MEKNPEFDDIRPYYDEEVAPAIERLLKNARFRKFMNYFFQGKDWERIESMMLTFTNRYDFQRILVREVVMKLLNQTAGGVSFENMENISKTATCTYISNHRDIVLDVSILCVLLVENGYKTPEIAIGDNLLLTDEIKDLVRLNKCFTVKRSVSGRQMLEVSKHLSKYIHRTIREKNQSIWIAQREGRAKDSNDRTQESVLKMLAMAENNHHFLNSVMELNLTPLTISYEYDPCDYLKAKEFQQKRDNSDFKKAEEDDLLNMQTGLFGYKGRINLQIGKPINPSLLELDDSLGRNELATQVAAVIDKEIFLNYKFFPINYIAYDSLWGKNFFREQYTTDDIKKVEQYFQQQLDKIDLPGKDIPYLMEKLKEMYAYPVKNFLSVSV